MNLMPSQKSYMHWQELLRTNVWFKLFWQFWSNYSFVFLVLVYLLLVFLESNFQFRTGDTISIEEVYAIIQIFFASLIAFGLTRFVFVFIINWFYERERPYQKYNFNPITSKIFSNITTIHNSFPSRHAGTFASLTFVVFFLAPYLGVILMVVAVMTGIARVVLGYHYPTDILAGFILGFISAIFSYYLVILVIFT